MINQPKPQPNRPRPNRFSSPHKPALGYHNGSINHNNPQTKNPNDSSVSTNTHRVVLGKGLRKNPEMLKHIAGARMNVMRKESTRGGGRRPSPARPLVNTKGDEIIPPLAPDSIRIIPLGGVEEIGRNMTAIEYGDDIVVIDIGFQFKDENTPGIDYILPNTRYLEERQSKIRAVLITHGHLDHIGGIP